MTTETLPRVDPLYAIGATEACERAHLAVDTLRIVTIDGRVIDGVPDFLESAHPRVRIMLPGARERTDYYGEDLPSIYVGLSEIDSIRPLARA